MSALDDVKDSPAEPQRDSIKQESGRIQAAASSRTSKTGERFSPDQFHDSDRYRLAQPRNRLR